MPNDVMREATFRLDELETVHNEAEPHPLGERDCFGDSALLAKVPMFERARRAVVTQFGYRLVSAETDFKGNYTLTPFLELGTILETRTIPFRRTTHAVRSVLEHAPSMTMTHSMLRSIFPRNCPHHETAHALFYELAQVNHGAIPLRGMDLVEVLVASEAAAVAMETLAALRCEDEKEALLLSFNVDADPFLFAEAEARHPGLRADIAALERSDPQGLFRFLAGAFLIANLRSNAVGGKPGLARWLRRHAGLDPMHDAKMVEILGALGLVVDVSFRRDLVPAFFRYLDLEAEYHALAARPLEAAFDLASSAFEQTLPAFIGVVLPRRRSFLQRQRLEASP